MIRSVIGILRVDPGLDPQNAVRIYPGPLKVGDDWGKPQNNIAARLARFTDAHQRIAAIPGVIGTGLIVDGRFGRDQDGHRLGGVEVSTAPDSPTALLKVQWIGVEAADPLRVLRVPLKRGRWLDRSDVGEGIPYVLVNETAARKLWPGEDAVGKQFWLEGGTLRSSMIGHAYQVIGVVADTVEYSGRSEAVARYQEGPEPTYYRPLENVDEISIATWSLVVRTAVNPLTLHKPIHEAIKATGADRVRPYFIDLPEVLRVGMAGHRTVMLYLSVFAGVGLLLAGIGLYGVLAYSVARRTREIGIRMALGAQIADVMRLILGQGLGLVGVGAVIGITVALATGRLLRAYLFGVSSTDPATFIAVALVLGVVALLACWLPARRATRVNPMEALRSE
jgi:putative ABC transport system permease protein